MPNYQSALYDVVIAGGGPVGLFLACELRLADLSVLVLEQAEDPCSPLKRLPFGMRGLSAPTLEAFYRRGMLERHRGGATGERRTGQQTEPRTGSGRRAVRAVISPAFNSTSTT